MRRARARRLALSALLGAAVLALPAAVAAVDAPAPLAVGALAPDFTLGDQHGAPFRLADARAKRDFVVLAFYVKAFTGG